MKIYHIFNAITYCHIQLGGIPIFKICNNKNNFIISHSIGYTRIAYIINVLSI